MLKKSPTTPSLPQARQHAPHPELRSRFDEILNVPHGKERVLARLGRVGEIGCACVSSSLRPRWKRFEHPAN